MAVEEGGVFGGGKRVMERLDRRDQHESFRRCLEKRLMGLAMQAE